MTQSPSIETIEPPPEPTDPRPDARAIKLGRTPGGRIAWISEAGRLWVGRKVVRPGDLDVCMSADGESKGLGGERILRFVLNIKGKAMRVRHVTSAVGDYWDVDDVGMRSDEAIESRKENL